MESFRILAINPGSTSTKIAVYDNENIHCEITIRHEKSDLDSFGAILEQRDYRETLIKEVLAENNISLTSIDAVVGRGGLIKPIKSGTYEINNRMLDDLKDPSAATHASSLGGIIASSIGSGIGAPSFIVDPVVVDERYEIAKLTGIPEIKRNSIWHALNQKSVGRKCALKLCKKYEECRFIIAHMGGGISVGAHKNGVVVDVTDGLYGEGPITPERSGALPAGPLIDLCFSGEYTRDEMIGLITKHSGLSAHLGTNNMIEAEKQMAEGNEQAKLVLEAMAYQLAKFVGSMAAPLEFRVDAVILTGGLANSKWLTGRIEAYVAKLAQVIVWPGEDEMEALALGALRVMRGEEEARVYE